MQVCFVDELDAKPFAVGLPNQSHTHDVFETAVLVNMIGQGVAPLSTDLALYPQADEYLSAWWAAEGPLADTSQSDIQFVGPAVEVGADDATTDEGRVAWTDYVRVNALEGHAGLDLVRPVAMFIDDRPELVTAFSPLLCLYAVGETTEEAVQALTDEIVEEYHDLNEYQHELGGVLKTRWAVLRRLISER